VKIIPYTTKIVFNSESDKDLVLETLKEARRGFNEASEVVYGMDKLSIVDLHKNFYRSFRDKNPQISSQIVGRCMRAVLQAYRSVKSNKNKIDRPVEKKKLSLELTRRMFSYKLKDNIFRIPILGGRISVKIALYKKLEKYLHDYEFKSLNVFERNGSIYLSFYFRVSIELNENPKLALGIDLGIRRFVATSDGRIFKDAEFNKSKRAVRFLKRSLKSKGTKSAKRHLRKIRHKEKNINKNFIFHLANAVLKTTADVIVVEDLNLIKMKKKKHAYQNKNRISQVGFGQLIQTLQYKAELLGKRVVKVNPAYTSQTDPVTGKREGVRKGCRFYAKSGKVYDADCAAAVNIARLSELPFSCVFVLDGQAVLNQPIVGRNPDKIS
jgi:putative transposase